jgi:Methyltransferase FkbM domain
MNVSVRNKLVLFVFVIFIIISIFYGFFVTEFFDTIDGDKMNPLNLTIYDCPFEKIRLGRDGDGGYIIADIPNAKYNILISGGINDDTSFEEDFINKFNSRVYAFDGTIDNLKKQNDKIIFIKKNIGGINSDTVTNLHDIINSNNNIFVKMDIEGGEIEWLKNLNSQQIDKFEQIVIEFHNPFTSKENEIFEKINNTHYLVHLHGNNCGGSRIHLNKNMANVFECTYVNKKYFNQQPYLNKQFIPGPLDMKNCEGEDDFQMNYSPFVNI